jgi:hypothetical protein
MTSGPTGRSNFAPIIKAVGLAVAGWVGRRPRYPAMSTALPFLLAFGGFALAAQPELPLPKCYIPIAELAATCKGALVATLVSVSGPDVGPPGASDFLSHWKVVRTLRGKYPSDAELSFRVQTFPEKKREREPTIGQTYILISYDTNPRQVAYIFEHTPEKWREIQQLLTAKPK